MSNETRVVPWKGAALVVLGLLLGVLDALGWFVLWSGVFAPSYPWSLVGDWPLGPFWALVLVAAVACIAAGFWQMRRARPNRP